MDFPSLEANYGCLKMITLQKGSLLHLNPSSAQGVMKEMSIFSPASYYNGMKKWLKYWPCQYNQVQMS